MMSEGWVKLHRQLLESKVFANPDLLKLWTLCLLKGNHKTAWVDVDGLTDPVEIKPGQFITGRYSLHRDFYTKKTNQEKSALTLWRWLKKLERWGNLNIKTGAKYSLVEICNWDLYQKPNEDEQVNEHQLNNRRTANEHQLNTNKNDNNDKNEKKSTPPTMGDVISYFIENGYSKEAAVKAFEYYNEPMKERGGRVWKDSNGKTVRSWKQKMRGVWFKPENEIQTSSKVINGGTF